MKAQVAAITKPVCSVRWTTEAGGRVVLDESAWYVESQTTGEVKRPFRKSRVVATIGLADGEAYAPKSRSQGLVDYNPAHCTYRMHVPSHLLSSSTPKEVTFDDTSEAPDLLLNFQKGPVNIRCCTSLFCICLHVACRSRNACDPCPHT